MQNFDPVISSVSSDLSIPYVTLFLSAISISVTPLALTITCSSFPSLVISLVIYDPKFYDYLNMRAPPLDVVRSWPRPNYVNPETRGPANKIIGLVLVGLVTITLAIRLYTRHFISKGLGLDDLLIVLAYIPATTFTIIGIVAEFKFGWNRHVWDVKPEFFTPGLQISLTTQLLFDLATSLTKLSMLALLYRITSAGGNKVMNRIVFGISTIIIVNCFIFILVTIFQCRPVSDYWTLSLGPQNCLDEGLHLLFAGIINTTTDFIVVLLPIPVVLRLELPRKQLIIVTALFGAGLLAAGAGIARTVVVHQMTSGVDHDVTWKAWEVWITSSLELYLGVLCASLPATKPFFSQYLPQFINTTIRNRDTANSFAPDMKKWQNKETFRDVEAAEVPIQNPNKVYSIRGLANLNKPLPQIHGDQLPLTAIKEEDSSSSYSESSNPGRPSGTYSQRSTNPFSDRSTRPFTVATNPDPDRSTTVFIMFKGDQKQQPRYQFDPSNRI